MFIWTIHDRNLNGPNRREGGRLSRSDLPVGCCTGWNGRWHSGGNAFFSLRSPMQRLTDSLRRSRGDDESDYSISTIMHSNGIIRIVAQVQLIAIIVGGVGDRNC